MSDLAENILCIIAAACPIIFVVWVVVDGILNNTWEAECPFCRQRTVKKVRIPKTCSYCKIKLPMHTWIVRKPLYHGTLID